MWELKKESCKSVKKEKKTYINSLEFSILDVDQGDQTENLKWNECCCQDHYRHEGKEAEWRRKKRKNGVQKGEPQKGVLLKFHTDKGTC